MRFRNHVTAAPAQMQLAPMIDIVFLLLIFFIVTWSYARFETELDVSVPAASESEDPKRSIGEIIVNVREDGTIVVEGREETGASLFARLSAITERFEDQAVILRGDKSVSYEHIVKTLNVCKEAGIWNIAFATILPEQAGNP